MDKIKFAFSLGVGVIRTIFQQYFSVSWLSDLLMEETRVPGENNRPGTSH
jgi:hypothetical protein